MSLKKILVAIDRSPQTPMVFEQALELAQQEESRLMIFHCVNWESEAEPVPFVGTLADVDMYGTFQQVQRKHLQKKLENAQGWLQTYYQQATSKDIPTEFDCQVGKPNLKICELAETWGADLIVLGRRGHKGISEIFLGSVSNYVVHHAPCSVLVIQGVTSPTIDMPAAATQGKIDT